MMPRLQEHRIGDDRAGGGEGHHACHQIFRAMEQDAHRQAALGIRFDRNRTCAAPAARHVVIPGNVSRHFSSPDGAGSVVRIATPASAWRYYWMAAAAAA